MKITFERGMHIDLVQEFFSELIERQSWDYPILKNDMTVNITLKHPSGDLNPDNENSFIYGKKDIQELQERRIRAAEQRLNKEWSSYTGSYYRNEIIKNIELNKRYLETAQEKKRGIVKIERCKQSLQRYERKLNEEVLRLEGLQRFIKAINENQVKYEYIEHLPAQWMRIMIFEMEETYIFEYELDVEGSGNLQLVQDSYVFDYLLENGILGFAY